MAEYVLPDLPYDYGALEPHISGQIMELHHGKHHATYVTGANTTLEQLAEARDKDSFGSVNGLEKSLAFHLGGHINHSVFWPNLSPDGGDKPDGELGAAIDEFFGTFDGFRAHFTANANAIQGSGWSMLVWDTLGQRLNIMQLFDQQGNLPLGADPDRAAGHVGARVLPAVQERQGRLRQGVVERRQLGRRQRPVHRRGRADAGAPHPLSPSRLGNDAAVGCRRGVRPRRGRTPRRRPQRRPLESLAAGAAGPRAERGTYQSGSERNPDGCDPVPPIRGTSSPLGASPSGVRPGSRRSTRTAPSSAVSNQACLVPSTTTPPVPPSGVGPSVAGSRMTTVFSSTAIPR